MSKPGGDEHLIQIRYSDTHEQKMLKQQTAAGRVFRAAEYEVGVAQARALSAGPDRYMTMSPDSQSTSNEFEVFLQQQVTGYMPSGQVFHCLCLTCQNSATPYVPATARYRQPWTPAVPSSLGMSRPAMHQTVNAPVFKVDDSGSDHGTDTKTGPATPVKQEATSSPTHHNGDE